MLARDAEGYLTLLSDEPEPSNRPDPTTCYFDNEPVAHDDTMFCADCLAELEQDEALDYRDDWLNHEQEDSL